VVTPHLRQVTPAARFLKAGAAVTGRAVDLSTDVLFAFGSDVLGPDAGAAIEVAAQQLQAQPSRTVTVTGHTDSQGDDAYNLGLSQRRAEAVRAALAAELGAGWTLDATGVGESDPVADESRPSGVSSTEADAAVAEAQRVDRRVAVVPG
jgi:outer membrane protein OmpA-like peptidoglycan-associated protein